MDQRFALLGFATLFACQGGGSDSGTFTPRGEAPDLSAPEPQLKRLTESQYLNAIADMFSDQIALTTQVDPLEEVGGLYAIGAGVSTVSPLGTERFETAAFQIAEQSMDDAETRDRLVPCDPESLPLWETTTV